jgi:hypothetical protein
MNKNNVLVTGAPRSGTTFVGRVINFSNETNYLWEPFNQNYRKGIPDYYPYLGESSSKSKINSYDIIIKNTINFTDLKPKIKFLDSDNYFVFLLKKIGINRTFIRYRLSQLRNIFFNKRNSIFKDPVGIFLSEHLIKKYNFKIVFVIRHPAAIFNSRKKLNWIFNYYNWEKQEDFLNDFFRERKNCDINYEKNILLNSSLHWLTCYDYIKSIYQIFPENTHLVRHEDLCFNPIDNFKKLFEFLDLEYNGKIKSNIINLTSGNKIEKSTTDLAKLEKRNAEKLVFKWKNNISEKELSKIRDITYKTSHYFYPEKIYWNI